MAQGLLDRVDCERLADDAAMLERVYLLGDMPRLQDLLADTQGTLRARFAFARVDSGRAGATVAVEAAPHLTCQRCLQGFAFAAEGSSEIEFTSGEEAGSSGNSQREFYSMDEGSVSLRELAEEEMLLALPIVAACNAPQSCGRAPSFEASRAALEMSGDRSLPFTGLQELLKKTLD